MYDHVITIHFFNHTLVQSKQTFYFYFDRKKNSFGKHKFDEIVHFWMVKKKVAQIVGILASREPEVKCSRVKSLIFNLKIKLQLHWHIFSYPLPPPHRKPHVDSARCQPGTRVITQLNTSRSNDSHPQLPPSTGQGSYHSIEFDWSHENVRRPKIFCVALLETCLLAIETAFYFEMHEMLKSIRNSFTKNFFRFFFPSVHLFETTTKTYIHTYIYI